MTGRKKDRAPGLEEIQEPFRTGLRETDVPFLRGGGASWRSPAWVLAVVGGGQIALTLTDVLGFAPPTPVATAIAAFGMLLAAISLHIARHFSAR